jgi:single-stranded DNA-binding protein
MKNVDTILIGRIAGDFQQRADGSVENTIVHATVKDGEEFTHFVLVRFRGKQAELVRKHLSKGDLCCIEGRRCEETTDTNVVKQYIEAGHITFLATRRQSND